MEFSVSFSSSCANFGMLDGVGFFFTYHFLFPQDWPYSFMFSDDIYTLVRFLPSFLPNNPIYHF
jgi:hypothetical protein